MESGVLYIVATPIGNRADISSRALEVLANVSLIAAEDTRHSKPLLNSFGIDASLLALHDHNERKVQGKLVAELQAGRDVALISDAGTPLVSDPGFPLVRACRELGIRVSPIPGACAAIAALSVAGLASDRFSFQGFPARTSAARREQFDALKSDPTTLVFYESSHRILPSLQDMADVFGATRHTVLARELTKLHETILSAPLGELVQLVAADENQRKGEFVLLVAGAQRDESAIDAEAERVLEILLSDLPTKQAAALAAKITGVKKNRLYQRALEISN